MYPGDLEGNVNLSGGCSSDVHVASLSRACVFVTFNNSSAGSSRPALAVVPNQMPSFFSSAHTARI